MTPREMAAAVAAIMTAVPAPQRETMNFSVQFAVELHRELCKFLFRDIENSFGQLDHLDNNTVVAFLTFLIETNNVTPSPIAQRQLTLTF